MRNAQNYYKPSKNNMKWNKIIIIIDGISKELFCRKKKFLLKNRRNRDLKALIQEL